MVNYPTSRIERSWEHADPMWRMVALSVVVAVAWDCDEFTVDDLWPKIEAHQVTTHDRRAIGGVLHRAVELGYCKPTGQKHNGHAVYQSGLRF